jgi:hypothetical protein
MAMARFRHQRWEANRSCTLGFGASGSHGLGWRVRCRTSQTPDGKGESNDYIAQRHREIPFRISCYILCQCIDAHRPDQSVKVEGVDGKVPYIFQS